MGSSVDFGGLKELFTSHGDVTIYDYCDMVNTGFIDKNYKVFWGVEDKLLYDYSKQKLNEISKNNEPFCFVIETVDTHNPNGYLCSECPDTFDNQYSNVVACASLQLNNFINWGKEQEWYENTTIMIVGDHCSMKKDFFADIDENYENFENFEAYKEEYLKLEKQEVLYIGDQMFLDTYGANKAGLDNILVKYMRYDTETKIGKKRTRKQTRN